MESDARLLMVELMTFGRPASREVPAPFSVSDHWHIRRGGNVVFAEALRLCGGPSDLLERASIAGGAATSALVLFVAPDAEYVVDRARLALADAKCEHGVSAWNGLLTARLLAAEPASAIAAVGSLAVALTARPMPRVWSI